MATTAQIEANRLNAQRSTGPRSAEGKNASRLNALQHGIDSESLVLPGEDPAQFEALAQSYLERLAPDGPVEGLLVETLVRNHWVQRRFARLEARYTEINIDPTLPPAQAIAFLFTDPKHSATFRHIFRRCSTALRDWKQALEELRRVQQERLTDAPPVSRAVTETVTAVTPPEAPVHLVSPAPLHPAIAPSLRASKLNFCKTNPFSAVEVYSEFDDRALRL